MKYQKEIRKKVYTTNIVESINSRLEYMRIEHMGYFASQEMLNANLFIQYSNLHHRWLRKADTRIVSVLYKIRQLFALRFELRAYTKVMNLEE